MKKRIALVACLIALLALTGCTQPSTATDPSSPVTLRFSWWGSQARHDAMRAIVDRYMALHENVQIEVEYGAFEGWEQKLLRQITSGNAPDIMQVDYNWVHSFGKGQNIFYDMHTLDSMLHLSDFESQLLSAMEVNGQLAAVPFGKTARMNLYSKALFDSYGLDCPDTYDDFLAAGRIISAGNEDIDVDNHYVLTNIGKATVDYFIAQMLYNNTGKPMQIGGTVAYTVDEVATVLEMYRQMEEAGAVPSFIQEDPIQNSANPVWMAGRSGSIREWVNVLSSYINTYKGGSAADELAIGPFLTEGSGTPVLIYIKPTESFAIAKDSQHPEVAAAFIDFLFTDEEAVRLLGDTFGVSSHKVTRAQQEREALVTGLMWDGYQAMETYPQVMLDPYFEDNDVRGARYKAIEASRTGVATAQNAAALYIDGQNTYLRRLYATGSNE